MKGIRSSHSIYLLLSTIDLDFIPPATELPDGKHDIAHLVMCSTTYYNRTSTIWTNKDEKVKKVNGLERLLAYAVFVDRPWQVNRVGGKPLAVYRKTSSFD